MGSTYELLVVTTPGAALLGVLNPIPEHLFPGSQPRCRPGRHGCYFRSTWPPRATVSSATRRGWAAGPVVGTVGFAHLLRRFMASPFWSLHYRDFDPLVVGAQRPQLANSPRNRVAPCRQRSRPPEGRPGMTVQNDAAQST